MTRKNVWQRLAELDNDFYIDQFWLVLYMLLGGLAPFLGAWSWKAMRIASVPVFSEFTLAGEFSLYAAAFVASAGYLLAYDRKKLPFPGRIGLLLLCGLLLVSTVFCYALVAPQVLEGAPPILRSPSLYSHVTVSLFITAVAFFVIVSVLDGTRTLRDIRSFDDEDVKTLRARVHDLPE